jgi:hypothetical protein
MTDFDPATPSQNTGSSVSGDQDTADLSATEELDEDLLDADPLEEAADPPEGWSAADKWGTTPFEERQGEPLDQRLAEEVPDVGENQNR